MVNLMVKYHSRLDATFQALADPTRRAILAALTSGQTSVSVLAAPHRMSLPAVMKHLQVLERAGLAQWFAPSEEYSTVVPELELRVGGRYRVEMHHKGGIVHSVSGTYQEITPPEK